MYRLPAQGELLKGSVVPVQDEGRSRLHWPLGVIQNVYPGKDGIVRTVQVKTAKGLLTRPIQKVHNMEIVRDNSGNLGLSAELSTSHTEHENTSLDFMNAEAISKPDADTSMNTVTDGSVITSVPKDTTTDMIEPVPGKSPIRTRAGRVVKTVRKMDL